MPSADFTYKRHYVGITKNGRKYILGVYYPSFVTPPGVVGCDLPSDMGHEMWWIEFDTKSHMLNYSTVDTPR